MDFQINKMDFSRNINSIEFKTIAIIEDVFSDFWLPVEVLKPLWHPIYHVLTDAGDCDGNRGCVHVVLTDAPSGEPSYSDYVRKRAISARNTMERETRKHMPWKPLDEMAREILSRIPREGKLDDRLARK